MFQLTLCIVQFYKTPRSSYVTKDDAETSYVNIIPLCRLGVIS